jgi:hypothetical protein
MDHDIVPVIAIVFIFGAPVAAFIVSRILRHAERIEMIRRGIIPPPEFDNKRAYRAWQKSGAPWPSSGSAQTSWTQPTAPSMPTAPTWNGPDDDPQRAMYKGIRLALIGFALTTGLGWGFGYHTPVILGGLVPMFVGVAQIIIALLSGAQLSFGQPNMTLIPPPPQQQPPPPGGAGQQQPPPGNYGAATPPPWAQQPGRARFEELSKPVQPPDVR